MWLTGLVAVGYAGSLSRPLSGMPECLVLPPKMCLRFVLSIKIRFLFNRQFVLLVLGLSEPASQSQLNESVVSRLAAFGRVMRDCRLTAFYKALSVTGIALTDRC